MGTRCKVALVLACALGASGAGATNSYTTVATGVIEKAVLDRAVCAVSNTSSLSVMVDEVRILNAAGAVLSSLGATTLGAKETLSLEHLAGSGQWRCEADVYDTDLEAVIVRLYNRVANRSDDGT